MIDVKVPIIGVELLAVGFLLFVLCFYF